MINDQVHDKAIYHFLTFYRYFFISKMYIITRLRLSSRLLQADLWSDCLFLPRAQPRDIETMLVQCWPDVVDGGLTMTQHCFNVSSLLGRSRTEYVQTWHSGLCIEIYMFWQRRPKRQKVKNQKRTCNHFFKAVFLNYSPIFDLY